MDEKKFLKILFFILILAGGILLWIHLSGTIKKVGKEKPVVLNQIADTVGECQVASEERIVRGSSLAPIIKDGETVKVLFGYYECNDIKRNDIILYSYAGNEAPLIKIVKGVPGDSFAFKEADGGWNILINGKAIANSEGALYVITGNRYKMLSLYEDDSANGIPPNTYLILGNLIEGSLDSTRFGFVDKSDMLGKVVY